MINRAADARREREAAGYIARMSAGLQSSVSSTVQGFASIHSAAPSAPAPANKI